MGRRFRALLCGYYGMGNFGDELLLKSCIGLLAKNGIGAGSIAVMSGSPADTKRCYNVTSVDRWNPKAMLRAALDSEMFILGGGGIFQDASSVRSVLYYWLVLRMAKLCGCRVMAVGQSVGPLRSALSRILTKNAFSLCAEVGVRDVHSLEALDGDAELTDDLALTLSFPFRETEKRLFLVNFRRTPSGIENAAAKDFAAVQLPDGVRSVGVAMSDDDASLMREMCAAGALSLDDIVTLSDGIPQDLFAGAAGAFGMRLHFGLLCLKHSVPCTMVPYDPKVKDFAERWGAPLWHAGARELPHAWRNSASLPEAAARIEEVFARAVASGK